jgi:hypothetical protein
VKGIVFCEFIGMVEECFSLEMADRIIAASNLATGGAYTSIGTYDHREIVELIGNLSAATGIPDAELTRRFGEHLCQRFALLYPAFFSEHGTSFSFLASVDDKIHVEAKKLYPDAELPAFDHHFPDASSMVLVYRSKRPFADLVEGLIRGCIGHYHETIGLARENLSGMAGTHARFTLKSQSHAGRD